MISLLMANIILSGLGVGAIAIFVGVGLGLGWPLVLNRRVIGALLLFLAVLGVILWRQHDKAELRAEGAREIAAANKAAGEIRAKDNAAMALDLSDAVKESQDRQMIAAAKLEAALKGRKSNVSAAADSRCIVPVGFVRDHDRDLPGAAGRAGVSAAASADADKPSGVPLSRVGAVVASNYTESAKRDVAVDEAERVRYEACVKWDSRYGTKSQCTR